MKTIVRFSLIILITSLILTGCSKSINGPQNGYPIVGSWVLTDAAKGNAYGWTPLSTGFEGGVFDFYGNGSASFSDSYGNYQGTWRIVTVSSGTYYDYYGNPYTDLHETFEVNLHDNRGNTIYLYFDDINFNNSNYFTTTYYKNNSVERYGFSRY